MNWKCSAATQDQPRSLTAKQCAVEAAAYGESYLVVPKMMPMRLWKTNPLVKATNPMPYYINPEKVRAVFFEKDGDKIVVWTNYKRWTVTDMVAGGTKRYTKQLAMALSASLMAEGYKATVYD